MSAGEEFARLVEIMHRLRQQCPWDRSQDHESLRAFLLEETYELLEVLDHGRHRALCEELGDLLLQIVFHAEIADENGEFDMEDILRGINEKLVRRHPHVFGDEEAPTEADVHRRWEHIKRDQEGKSSVLAGVPRELPALLKAMRVLAKIHQSGLNPFDGREPASEAGRWLDRLCAAAAERDGQEAERAAGMLCLVIAELADRADANAEDALRGTLTRLAHAYCQEEEKLRERGLHFADLSGEELGGVAARLLARCERGGD